MRTIYVEHRGAHDWRSYCLNWHGRRYLLDVVEWDPWDQVERLAADRFAGGLIPPARPRPGSMPAGALPHRLASKVKLTNAEMLVPEIVGHLTGEMPPTTPWPDRWRRLGASAAKIEGELLPLLRGHRLLRAR